MPFVILSCYLSSLSSIFSPNQMFSSPPIKMQYMQKYIHIIINMIVVRLPYILENPLNTSTYTENTQEMTIHPSVENTAPGSCLLYVSLLLGRNLYINSKNTIITIGVIIFLARISQSAIFLKNGTCSAIKIFKLLPNTDNTSKHYCINSCSYPKKKIVTCLTAIIHTVQS